MTPEASIPCSRCDGRRFVYSVWFSAMMPCSHCYGTGREVHDGGPRGWHLLWVVVLILGALAFITFVGPEAGRP